MKIRNPLVSVIIPVYNAEQTIGNMLLSMRNQSYSQIELIFVNDASEDNSLELIQKYTSAFHEKGYIVCIVSHALNKGVAEARNTGLSKATGDYVYYVDADDQIEPHAIKMLVDTALDTNVDIVGCNWFLTFNKDERKMNQPSFSQPLEAIVKMLAGTMRWNLWLFLVRRSLYEEHEIRFLPEKNMGEDLMVMIKLFVHASSVAYLDCPLYHYGQSNKQSLTKVYSDKHIEEVTCNMIEAERTLRNSQFSASLGNSIDFLKLNIKLPLLISDRIEQYNHWLSWFPEANDKVMLNKMLPFRIRLLQWLAVKKQFWAVQLYYHLVVRFVYGVLYK